MNLEQKQILRDTADHLRRLFEQLREKHSGAPTPESRLALAGSYALLALAFEDEEGAGSFPRKNWTVDACKDALESIGDNADKPIDFQN